MVRGGAEGRIPRPPAEPGHRGMVRARSDGQAPLARRPAARPEAAGVAEAEVGRPHYGCERRGMRLWSRLWIAWMCRTVRLRARIRIECVSARWPMRLIPGSSGLSLIPV